MIFGRMERHLDRRHGVFERIKGSGAKDIDLSRDSGHGGTLTT